LGVYGQSKLAGERAIQARHARHLMFRTSWVHGPRGGNFIRTMLRLAGERESLSVVDDQIGAPTGAPLIAEVTARAIARVTARDATTATARVQQALDLAGTYHLAAAGEASWWDVACQALSEASARGAALRCSPEQVTPIPSTQYPTPAQRPLNSRLNTRKLREAFGLALPAWQDGVRQTVQALLASDIQDSSSQA
jgi:dTDP-4-dehydrorhamnose reductase